MPKNPKVSVILTSYNHAKYLREAIESVLNQTFSDFEFIIIDDASIDNSWEIICSYFDPRILAFRNENVKRIGSAAGNIRKVLSEINAGEYIAIHHSDDVWEPQKLERQVAFLNTNPQIGAVFTRAQIIDEDGQPFQNQNHPYYQIFEQNNRTRHEWLNRFFYQGNALCHPSVMIRKHCYEDIGLYRYGMAQLTDFDMWVRLCSKYEIHILPEKLVRFRVHTGDANVSGDKPEARIRIQFEYLQIYSNYIEITDRDEFLKIFPEALVFFENEDFDIPFALAMLALASSHHFAPLFGLNLLFEALNESNRARKIKELYDFSPQDFIALTAKYDVFSIELVSSLMVQVAERDSLLAEKDTILAEKNTLITEIINSKAWKLVSFLRKLRVKLLPHGSWREETVRWVYRILRVLSNEPVSNDYKSWIRNNEPNKKLLRRQRKASRVFSYQPKISIVMPVYNISGDILKSAIKSVMNQTYDNWELCITNGNSDKGNIHKTLKAYAKKDKRIKLMQLKENLGIAANTNAALTLITGDFVGFLDHDDLLAPFALFEVVKHINRDLDVDLIYSDEDKVTETGDRFDPFFKPNFGPDTLRSSNFISHFLVIRRSLGVQLEWFRSGFDGAQDYDFVLRVTEKTDNIGHISKILYHWRTIQNSTAKNIDAKPEADIAGRKALQEHLIRCGVNGVVTNGFIPTWHRIKYNFKTKPLVSIIIPNSEHGNDLQCCVKSILEKSSYSNFEIFIVENNSYRQSTFQIYQQLQLLDKRISVLEWKKDFNFSSVNNWAVEKASSDILLFLNNDIEVITPEWLEEMLQHALRPQIGAVGAKLYFPDRSIQHAGVVIGIGGIAGHEHKGFPKDAPGYFGRLVQTRNVSAVTAACLMVRKDVFNAVKGFDEKYALAFGDVDFCLAVRSKGYLNIWTPYAELYHHESKTRGYEDTPEKQGRFLDEIRQFQLKWGEILKDGDPYYNPNLTLDNEDFSFR